MRLIGFLIVLRMLSRAIERGITGVFMMIQGTIAIGTAIRRRCTQHAPRNVVRIADAHPQRALGHLARIERRIDELDQRLAVAATLEARAAAAETPGGASNC